MTLSPNIDFAKMYKFCYHLLRNDESVDYFVSTLGQDEIVIVKMHKIIKVLIALFNATV